MNIIVFILIQVITFVILFLLFRNMISVSSAQEAKRLRSLSDEVTKKSKVIDEQIKEAQQKAEVIELEAKEQAKQLKQNTLKEVEVLRSDLLNQARAESDRIIQQANNTKEKIKEEFTSQNAQQVVDQAIKFLHEVLSAKSLQAAHNELVHELIEQMNSLDISKMQIQADKGELISPYEIKKEDKDKVVAALSLKVGKPIVLEDVINKNLVGGICIKLGSLVIDGSLAKKLNEAAANSRAR